MAPAHKSTALAEVQEEVKQVRGLLAQFNTTQDLGQRQQLCWQLVQLCCVHAYKMLEAVYPVLERALDQGRMEQLLQQHCAVLKKLQAVDELSWHQLAADPGRHAQLTAAAVVAFLHHTAAEDEAVHAAGVEGLGARQLSQLDRAWVVAAYHAPTRPHPDSPLRPHARVVEAHLAEAPLDRAADHFRATVIVPHNAEMESRRAKLGVRHHHHHHPSTHDKHAHGSKEEQVEETLTFITPTAAPAVGAGATAVTRKRRATTLSTSRREEEVGVEGSVGADKSEEEDDTSEGDESESEVSDVEKSEEEGCEDEEKETKASQAALETGAVVQGGERAWHKKDGAMGRAVQAAAEPAGEMQEDDC